MIEDVVDTCPHCGSENELHEGNPKNEDQNQWLRPEADSSRKEDRQYADLRS